MQRPDFFIGRYPDSQDMATIRHAQNELREVDKIKLVQTPHLTHAGSKDVVRMTLGLSAENLNTLIHPLPESATEPMSLEVKGLRSVQGRRLLPYLIIALDDPEGIFRKEHDAICDRIQNYLCVNPGHSSPHITLGRVSIESLNLDLVNRVEDMLPPAIAFQPVSFPEYTDENVGEVTNNRKLEPRHRPVVVKRAPVPEGLLKSIRTKNQDS